MIAGLALIACMQVDKPALEWRVLLIIKQTTNVDMPGGATFRAPMRDDDVNALTKVFADHTPRWIAEVTHGRVTWKATVVTSAVPLATLSGRSRADEKEICWLTPDDVKDDLAQHVKPREYDGVFICWKLLEDSGRTLPGVCWSIEPQESLNQVGFSSLPYTTPATWTADSMAFVREWLQQLEKFYAKKGIELPSGGPASYGFPAGQDLKSWYAKVLNGEVEGANGAHLGLGERAWAFGTVRTPSLICTPEFLVGKLNLLRNGSFESGAKEWAERSAGGKFKRSEIDDKVAKGGKRSAKLWTTDGDDDPCLSQKVSVKPRTRYLLSAWIRTKDVVLDEKMSQVGAHVGIVNDQEPTSSLVGTHEWTYVFAECDSGERKELEIALRLGQQSSVSSGTAWFDGVCLVEVPP